jgi:SPP1 family predicted phage head-tail adaptor
MSLLDAFNDCLRQATLYRRNETTDDNYGGREVTWTDSGLRFRVAIRQLSEQERYWAMQHGYNATVRFYADTPDLNIKLGDRIVYDGDDLTYDIYAINDLMHMGALLQIDAGVRR